MVCVWEWDTKLFHALLFRMCVCKCSMVWVGSSHKNVANLSWIFVWQPIAMEAILCYLWYRVVCLLRMGQVRGYYHYYWNWCKHWITKLIQNNACARVLKSAYRPSENLFSSATGRWVCIDFRQIKIHHPNVASLFCLLCFNIVVNFIFECSKLKREKTSDSLSLLFDSIQLHVQRIYFGSNEKIYNIDFPSKFKCSLWMIFTFKS